MMSDTERVKECLDRLRVVRNTDYGRLSEGVLHVIMDLHDLTNEEKEMTLAEVDKRWIRILINGPPPVRPKKKELVVIAEKEHQARLTQALEECMQAFRQEDDATVKRYFEEIPVFEEFVRKQMYKGKGSYRTIVEAMMRQSKYRVRKIPGWTCGTGMSDTKLHLAKWLQLVFPENTIRDLISRCEEHSEPNGEELQIMLLLLRNVPSTIVYPFKNKSAVFLTAEKIRELEKSHEKTNQ